MYKSLFTEKNGSTQKHSSISINTKRKQRPLQVHHSSWHLELYNHHSSQNLLFITWFSASETFVIIALYKSTFTIPYHTIHVITKLQFTLLSNIFKFAIGNGRLSFLASRMIWKDFNNVLCLAECHWIPSATAILGGSVAEWLACWTQAQKGLGSNRSRDAIGS